MRGRAIRLTFSLGRPDCICSISETRLSSCARRRLPGAQLPFNCSDGRGVVTIASKRSCTGALNSIDSKRLVLDASHLLRRRTTSPGLCSAQRPACPCGNAGWLLGGAQEIVLTAEGSPAYHPDGSILEPLPPPLNNRPDRSGRGAAALAPAITVKVRSPLPAPDCLVVSEHPLCRPANPPEEIAVPTEVLACMFSRFLSVQVLILKQSCKDTGCGQFILQGFITVRI